MIKIIDLSKRKPKNCPHCYSKNFEVSNVVNYKCLDCKQLFVRLMRGELYLKK